MIGKQTKSEIMLIVAIKGVNLFLELPLIWSY